MSMRPPLNPFGYNIIKTTAEQDALALKCTREKLTAVRDLMRELDLPADAFAIALHVYNEQLSNIVSAEERKKNIEREKKVRAEVKKRTGEAVSQFGTAVAMQQGGQGYMGAIPYSPLEDEIRAQLELEDDEG